MAGPDEAVAALAEAEEGETLERRRREVEAPAPVLLQKGRETGSLLCRKQAPPVQPLPGDVGVAIDHLERTVAVRPVEGGAQNRVACAEPRPGSRQGLGIEIDLEPEDELADVEPGLGGEQRVDQHSLLHRRGRIDVVDPPTARQPVEARLVEAGEGEVRGGASPGAGLEAVSHDLSQPGGEASGQALHRLAAVEGGAVGETHPQPPLHHRRGDLQQVGPAVSRAYR